MHCGLSKLDSATNVGAATSDEVTRCFDVGPLPLNHGEGASSSGPNFLDED